MPRLYQSFTAAEDALLGTMTDHRLAKRLKRKFAEVYLRRRELRIEPYGMRRVRWGNLHLRMLGTVPDGVLAARMGTTVETVRTKREAMGIEVDR